MTQPRRQLVFLAVLTFAWRFCAVAPLPPAMAGTNAGNFVTFDPTGSIFTEPAAINALSEITGVYEDASGTFHGFLRKPPYGDPSGSGTVTSFDAIGAVGTFPLAINDSETIAGFYMQPATVPHSFYRIRNGNIYQGDPTGAISSEAVAINASGMITGSYDDSSGFAHGYIAWNGRSITFDVPGAVDTDPLAINGDGTTAGVYVDSSNLQHCFSRTVNGIFTTFDPTNSSQTGFFDIAINSSGTIVGSYNDVNSIQQGFVRASDGTLTELSFSSQFTQPTSIDPVGTVVGWYADASNFTHGFRATATQISEGRFLNLDPPGSSGTLPRSINASGFITGDYADANGVYHGFFWIP